ncbi:MAG: hypothetical protein R3253_10885 [Longimicrobiales bacterium]|nr:hypothetical protein [Longimicrobiales bacterium]
MLEVAHLSATAFMAGVIVFVQVVHYPLMGAVGRASFSAYQRGHTARTGWVVIPAMLLELFAATWIALERAGTPDAGVAWAGLAMLAGVWISTAALQAPAHGRLMRGFDEAVHRRLVTTNWLRTVLWVARVPVAVSLLP